MARISTKRCKACRNSAHAECALRGCYCNCAGMKVTAATIKEREAELIERIHGKPHIGPGGPSEHYSDNSLA